jgi:hypothetical protein
MSLAKGNGWFTLRVILTFVRTPWAPSCSTHPSEWFSNKEVFLAFPQQAIAQDSFNSLT